MNNKIKCAFFLFLFPMISHAFTQFGRVVDVKGSGFISYQGKTHEIKKGETLYVNSEIVIEHSGQVSFTDLADHRFHLGSSSSVAIFAKNVELRSGDLWMQSINNTDEFQLTTANAQVNYQMGESILSYDSTKGKTQLMVLNGLMKFSNLRVPELNLTVGEGNFSFVDLAFEEGMPRDPTPVGEKTYQKLISLFHGIAPIRPSEQQAVKVVASRSVASVPSVDEAKKTIHAEIHSEKLRGTEKVTAVKMTKNKRLPKSSQSFVKIYGMNKVDTSVTTAIYDIPNRENKRGRAPASILGPETAVDQSMPGTLENMNSIQNKQQQNNNEHKTYKESEKLIEELNKL